MGSHAVSPVLTGTKARITALCQHEERLYVGCADGSLRVYKGDELDATHNLSRRPIDALDVLPVAGQLVVLTDSTVTLHKLAQLGAKGSFTTLSQARYPHALAATTYFAPNLGAPERRDSEAGGSGATSPTKVKRDLLVIGCRKKVVIYGAGRALGEAWELALTHSPRAVIFPQPMYAELPDSVHLLYSLKEAVVLHIQTGGPVAQRLSTTDLPSTGYPPTVTQAAPAAAEGGWGGALSFGYLRQAAVPVGTRTVGGEVLLLRDDLGVFFSSEGHFTRDESLQWATPPDNMAFANPYIYSVIPPTSATATPTIDVHLAPTLTLRQTITFPSPSAGTLTVSALSTASVQGRKTPRLLLVTTPTDKTLLQSEGSSVWEVRGATIGEQVDELVRDGRVTDAIGLVEAVGDADLAPSQRLPHLKVLLALSQFAKGDYKAAMEAFIVHNVHPAKVVALYPKQSISGNLAVPKEQWTALFGAEGALLEPPRPASPPPVEGEAKPGLLRNAHLALARKRSNDSVRTVSTTKDEPQPPPMDENVIPRQAIDELIYYLSDRRQKLAGAIPLLKEPLPAESDLPPLAELPAETVHALPDKPFVELEPEQLLRTAQVVYTSLLKVYLVARPSLVGSLCRIENWCDVAEVEPLLREKGRIDDLRDLYMQKSMHDKALSMLLEQAKEEEDPLDRYPPTIRYLQKLGPKHLPLIFDSARWIFDEGPQRGLQIFTADEPEVDALPRAEVASFLERTHWQSAITYLEHVIELGETSPELHDKLAELYLRRLRTAEGDERDAALKAFLGFLNSSTHYRAYRVLRALKTDEAPQARATLLGRMGQHDDALRIYVYELQDYAAAEAHCARVYAADPSSQLFLHLLKLYLLPSASSSPSKSKTGTEKPSEPLIEPALGLVSRHGTRIPPRAVLDLLPPLVPVKRLHTYFQRTLADERARRNEHRVARGLLSARKLQVEGVVCGLEVRRVRVTDQRICPMCQKRLGTSAIAVHAPRGEVTHLHCKDLFTERLERLRA